MKLIAIVAGSLHATDIYDGTTRLLGRAEPPMRDGYHLFFDGVDDIVTIGSFPPLYKNTLEAWVKPTQDAAVSDGLVVANGGGPMAFCGIGVSILAALREICYETDETGCGNGLDICVHYDVDAQWVHLAGTFDGNTSRIYVNGRLVHQVDDVVVDSGNWMTIGGYQFYNGYQSLYGGEMDEVRIWNIVRTEEDIQRTMFTRLTGKEAGLVAYWDFDEGEGFHIRNQVENRFHGFLGSNGVLSADAPKWVPSRVVPDGSSFNAQKAVVTH